MKNKGRKIAFSKIYFLFAVSVFLTISSCLVSLFDSSFAIDSFCYSIHDYNEIQSDVNPTILKVTKTHQDKPELYSSIYSNYKYNRTINGLRMRIDNNVETDHYGFKTNPFFFFQITSSISPDLDKYNSYSVDDGLFSSYFSPEELGPNYKSNRGSNCFAYISDSLAYKLINKTEESLNDYSGEKDSFLDLIKGDEYVLMLRVGNSEISCSINSVLYSNKRSASRIFELYGDFVLIFNFQFFSAFHTSVEFDLKQGMYANRNLVNTLKSLDTKSEEYNFDVQSFDSHSGKYVTNSRLTSEINKIMSDSFGNSLNVIYWLLMILIVPFYLLFGYFESTKRKLHICIFIVIVFFVFNIVSNFIYIYYAFNSPIIVFVIASVLSVFERKGLKNGNAQNFNFYEIGI